MPVAQLPGNSTARYMYANEERCHAYSSLLLRDNATHIAGLHLRGVLYVLLNLPGLL